MHVHPNTNLYVCLFCALKQLFVLYCTYFHNTSSLRPEIHVLIFNLFQDVFAGTTKKALILEAGSTYCVNCVCFSVVSHFLAATEALVFRMTDIFFSCWKSFAIQLKNYNFIVCAQFSTTSSPLL